MFNGKEENENNFQPVTDNDFYQRLFITRECNAHPDNTRN